MWNRLLVLKLNFIVRSYDFGEILIDSYLLLNLLSFIFEYLGIKYIFDVLLFP
jgi:hypothetical protein